MAWQYWWASSRWAMLLFLILMLCMDTFGFRVLTHSSHLRSLREKVDDKQNDNSKSFPSPDESFQFNTSVLEKYSIMKGLVLRPTVTGVYLKLEAYPIGGSKPIGYLNAFLRPLPPGIFHLGKLYAEIHLQYSFSKLVIFHGPYRYDTSKESSSKSWLHSGKLESRRKLDILHHGQLGTLLGTWTRLSHRWTHGNQRFRGNARHLGQTLFQVRKLILKAFCLHFLALPSSL